VDLWRISCWVERVTNRAMMERMKNLGVMNAINRRKLEYLGLIMRNESITF